MRILIKVLFLVSFGSIGVADAGDIFDCEMSQFIRMDLDGGLQTFENEKFRFVITRGEIIFGEKPPMDSKKLRLKDYIEELDAFHAEGNRSKWPSASSEEHMTFYGNRFTYGSLSPGLAVIAVGWCSKF